MTWQTWLTVAITLAVLIDGGVLALAWRAGNHAADAQESDDH